LIVLILVRLIALSRPILRTDSGSIFGNDFGRPASRNWLRLNFTVL
jgi:hypothetical protein